MSEENGKKPFTNKLLLEVFTAIVRAAEDTKLPVSSVRSRLALNRNHLKPLIEALEESRAELQRRFKVRGTETGGVVVVDEDVKGLTERMKKIDAFEAEHKALMDGKVEWSPCATIELRKIPDDSTVNGNHLAALMEVGILVGEPAPEEGPDKKGKS